MVHKYMLGLFLKDAALASSENHQEEQQALFCFTICSASGIKVGDLVRGFTACRMERINPKVPANNGRYWKTKDDEFHVWN